MNRGARHRDVAQISADRREDVVGARSDGWVQLLLTRHRQRPQTQAAPSFAAAGFEPLTAPFEQGVVALGRGPGEAVLSAHLTVPGAQVAIPVHWELSRESNFRELERYGLLLAGPANEFALRVTLNGLEPGRAYWARCWAGGHWSRAARLHSASHQTARPAPASFPVLAPVQRGWQRSAS